MEEILCMQKNAPQPVTAKGFLLGAAGVVLRLAIAQIVVNLAIALTGTGLLNIAFYLYAVALLLLFMRRTVAGSTYALRENTLVLQSLLGDSTTAVVEIPLSEIRALRPVCRCEDLHLCYSQVTVIDAQAKPGLRRQAAFLVSLFSARLARRIAGKDAQKQAGWVAVFEEDKRLRACVFMPNEEMLDALRGVLGNACGADDRMARPHLHTIYARALQRAFPEQYPHVEPLVREQDMLWAREEIERQKDEKKRAQAWDKKRRDAREAAKRRKKKAKRKRSGKPASAYEQMMEGSTEDEDEVHDDPV